MSASPRESSQPNGSRRRTAANLRLPKVTFEKVREIVDASRQLRGPASAAVIADQIGRTAKGQAWSDQWGTVLSLGFIERTADGRYDRTELGRRFSGEDTEDAGRAAQEGLMRSGFGPLIKRFGTGAPNVKAIANVFVSDYGVPETAAGKAAELLVEMADECRLVVEGRFKPAEIERAVDAVGDAGPLALPVVPTPRSSKRSVPTPATDAIASATAGHSPTTRDVPEASALPATAGAARGWGSSPIPFGALNVVLKIDATKLSAVEIAQIVEELRKTVDSS